MSDGLSQLTRHINKLLSRQNRPLFLYTDAALRLVESRGDAAHFGLPGLTAGAAMDEYLPVLAGIRAADGSAQVWRFVNLPGAPVCHVHLIGVDNGWGVALLDASAEHADQQVRQQAAHELLLLRDERERLLAELQQANRLKGEFIARMSHEFRTPLTSVIGYGEQLRDVCDGNRDASHHVAAVVRGGRYLLNLVENLLDQARIEIDQLELNPSACDLHELSEEIEQLLRPLAEQKQLSLAWWFDGGIPPRVWLDATRLEQVLINLVGNAIKFTHEGGVNVEFDWQQGQLRVAISDTGPGIGDSDAAAVFEPFRQADAGRRTKGAGLGLAISQSLVRAMGGEITLTSGKGQGKNPGSRFEFNVDAATIGAGGSANPDILAGRRILLVDDDPDLLELFTLYLKAAGCSVENARDSATAIDMAQRFRPDAIVLDLNLGDTQGTDLAVELRDAGYRNKIALLSANASVDLAARTPIEACWRKPISRAQLLEGLAGLIG